MKWNLELKQQYETHIMLLYSIVHNVPKAIFTNWNMMSSY